MTNALAHGSKAYTCGYKDGLRGATCNPKRYGLRSQLETIDYKIGHELGARRAAGLEGED